MNNKINRVQLLFLHEIIELILILIYDLLIRLYFTQPSEDTMNNKRPVTENDFRMEEFKNKDPADYEFRQDGKIVRKDRWETGIRNISSILNCNNFEISEVVERVRELSEHNKNWSEIGTIQESISEQGCDDLSVKMKDGSILKMVAVRFDPTDSSGKIKEARFSWNNIIIHEKDIEAFK